MNHTGIIRKYLDSQLEKYIVNLNRHREHYGFRDYERGYTQEILNAQERMRKLEHLIESILWMIEELDKS